MANCSTVAFRLTRQLWPGLKPDWRVLVAGLAPNYTYEIGALAHGLVEGEDFSAGIRVWVAGRGEAVE